MTEEAKKRMEELEDAMVQHWRENFKTTADGYGLKRYGFKRGYEAGMCDPDANAEIIVRLKEENENLKKELSHWKHHVGNVALAIVGEPPKALSHGGE